MKLECLLQGLEYTVSPSSEILNQEIDYITSDSRKAVPNSIFVCIKGEKTDGHDFTVSAHSLGCPVIIAEHQTEADASHIIVADTHYAYSIICANFFGRPCEKLKLVGVTGTNGKTTTTFAIKHILERNGHKSGLVGTLANMAGDEVIPAKYTTPEPFELQQLFRKMVDAGCEYAVMEVSSHALAQQRVAGCQFAAGVFSNLTQDHLDFHKTMENYLEAKEKLFSMSDVGIINLDDSYSDSFLKTAKCKTVTYSAQNMQADFTARNIRYRNDGIDYEFVGTGVIGRMSAPVPGGFSVYNTLAAASTAVSLGLPLVGILDALKTFNGVKGRIEVVPTGRDFSIIIDYAHTPDALEKILKSVKSFANGRVVALFGCGGDRDRTKRPLMGKIAAQNADYLIVTSDNPRSEEPMSIINEIVEGIKGERTKFVTIESRIEAIRYAILNAKAGDLILLAGKGHEDYQIIKTGKIHLDEREVISDVLKELAAAN